MFVGCRRGLRPRTVLVTCVNRCGADFLYRVGPENIADVVDLLIPGFSNSSRAIPRWPPDVFCICAAILQRSGSYALVVEDAPPHLKGVTSPERVARVIKIASEWRLSATGSRGLPPEVLKWWATLISHLGRPLARVAASGSCFACILNLLAAADEASFGVGIGSLSGDGKSKRDPFLEQAEALLIKSYAVGSSLCQKIHPSRARILPKMHTAQNGLTIRSFSHYLAYCPCTGVKPQWSSLGSDTQHHALNLLVVPWPPRIHPSQFKESKRVNLTDEVGKGGYGLFTYDPQRGPRADYIKKLVAIATRDVGQIDGVVFPELSMSRAEYDRLAKAVVRDKTFLIAGTGTRAAGANHCGQNELEMRIRVPDSSYTTQIVQKKHHRWKLTKSQIMQYGIGANLHPEANWWEHISLRDRSLAFITLRPWLTLSLLICEDLARPDPVADLVRAVGPNLVICLLMDGPQLAERWPARYAGSLSDDPGSSVLTITSIGMSRLSKPFGKADRSSVIALWRDAVNGTREIELPPRADAVVLNLSVEYKEEWTADGRGDGCASGYPLLTGVHPISADGDNRLE